MRRLGAGIVSLLVPLGLLGCASGLASSDDGGDFTHLGDGPTRPPRTDGSVPPDGPPSQDAARPPDGAPPPDGGPPPDGAPPPDGPPPDAPPPPGPCGAGIQVTPITIPANITMSTSGGQDNFHAVGSTADPNSNCFDSDGQGSPDRAFSFTLAQPTNIIISTGNSDFPVVLYIRDGDCRTYEGCDNQGQTGNAPASLQAQPAPAGSYIFIVDGFNASGTFHLTVNTF